VPEVEPGQDASLFDLLDDVAQVNVRACRTCREAGERELDLTGAEECAKRLDHRAAVTRVRRGVLGEIGRRTERPPRGIRFGRGVRIGRPHRDRDAGRQNL
jgi:hypothetical protein